MPLPFAVAPVQTIGLPILVLLSWIPYHLRARALAREHRPVPTWRQVCFASGLLVLEVAFSSPVDHLADQLLLAHMVEHLLIGDIASLLLVLGLTGPLIAPLLRNGVIAKLRVLTHPVVAVVVWGTNFYVWHVPYLYQACLRHDALHALEHATFLVFGMAVWMGLLGPLPKPRWFTNSAALVYIIAMRLIGTVLANILVFGGTVFYPYYRAGDAHWHISAMADQVAAGGIMMVEESLLTIGLFCWLFLRVARQSEQRQAILDYADQHDLDLDESRAARAVAAGRGDELWTRLRERAGDQATEARTPAEAEAEAEAEATPSL
ncbi:MAG: cytochrome c oxidase assembly protein [Solirubrobacterales bacterium]|nr:cytochrome c oxidase assembly protein [Solirubrobacterales bacterium]